MYCDWIILFSSSVIYIAIVFFLKGYVTMSHTLLWISFVLTLCKYEVIIADVVTCCEEVECRCTYMSDEVWVNCDERHLVNVPSTCPSNLTLLTLIGNNITSLQEQDFTSYPLVTQLGLSDNQISEIDPTTFTNVRNLTSLSLASNHLTADVLNSGVFDGLTQLKHLTLSDNMLQTISVSSFKDLTSLTNLELDKNQIESLSKESLEGLAELRELSLKSNYFRAIPTDAFTNTPLLSVLIMSLNSMVSLEARAFVPIQQLGFLDLGHSEIKDIDNQTFYGLNNLTTLLLNHNQLTSVPGEAMKSLVDLNHLDLSGNPISGELTSTSFPALPALTQLDMVSTLISYIQESSLGVMQILTTVRLRDNSQLTGVHENAFKPQTARSLRHLDLHNCSLSTLHELMLPWCDLQSVMLTGNPWDCKCNLLWLHYYLNFTIKSMNEHAVCVSPDEHRNKSIKHLRSASFCESAVASSVDITAVFIVCAIIFGLIMVTVVISHQLYRYYSKAKAIEEAALLMPVARRLANMSALEPMTGHREELDYSDDPQTHAEPPTHSQTPAEPQAQISRDRHSRHDHSDTAKLADNDAYVNSNFVLN